MNGKVTVYGYRFTNGILEVDSEQSRLVQKIFEVYNSGVPVSRLKDSIEGLTINRIRLSDILSDRRYLGDEKFPQIIAPELFQAAQERKRARLREIGKEQQYIYYKERFSLGDKISCGECGGEYHYYKHGEVRRWECSRRLVKGKVACRNLKLQNEQIESLFLRFVNRITKRPDIIRNISPQCHKGNSYLQAVEREIEVLKHSESDPNDAKDANGGVPQIDQLLRLIYKRAALQYESADDGSAIYYTKKIEELIQQRKEQRDKLQGETAEKKQDEPFDKELFDAIIRTILIYRDGRVAFTLKNGAIITEIL